MEHILGPFSVIGRDNDNLKTMLFTLDPHTFRIIHMQVDPEGCGVLTWRPVRLGSMQICVVDFLVDESVDTGSVKA